MNLNQLKNLKQPKFVLIKDLKTPYMAFDTVNDFIAGDVICLTNTLAEAESLIPNFTFPSDVEKQKLYIEIFEDGDDMETGDELEYVGSNLPWAIIDPEDCPFDSGKDVFGVTYTVVWVCPVDKKMIVDHLMKQIQGLVKRNKSSLGSEISYIWDEILERIIFTDDDKSKDESIRYDIKGDFEARLKQLPSAPAQADWGYLDEMWSK